MSIGKSSKNQKRLRILDSFFVSLTQVSEKNIIMLSCYDILGIFSKPFTLSPQSLKKKIFPCKTSAGEK